MPSKRYQDCIDVLGPGNESRCRDLEARAEVKDRRRLAWPMRSGEGVAPGALVLKNAVRLPPGWIATNGKTSRKVVANRTAILFLRDDKYRLILLDSGVLFAPSTGRLDYESAGTAAELAEQFLSGDRGDFLPIREVRRSGGQHMAKPTLRQIIRRSVGIGVGPPRGTVRRKPTHKVTGQMRRLKPASASASDSSALAQAVEKALKPIRDDVRALVANASAGEAQNFVDRSGQVDYGQLRRARRQGRLQARSQKPRSRRGGYIVRTVPNSRDAATGQPQTRLTVRSAVRRSLGLGYRPPVKVVGRNVRDAIAVEGHKARLTSRAAAILPAGTPINTGGIVDPMTGLRFTSREAYNEWLEATRNQSGKGVPFI